MTNPLADLWTNEMRSNALAALRALWIHVVDAETQALYDRVKAEATQKWGDLGPLEWEATPLRSP